MGERRVWACPWLALRWEQGQTWEMLRWLSKPWPRGADVAEAVQHLDGREVAHGPCRSAPAAALGVGWREEVGFRSGCEGSAVTCGLAEVWVNIHVGDPGPAGIHPGVPGRRVRGSAGCFVRGAVSLPWTLGGPGGEKGDRPFAKTSLSSASDGSGGCTASCPLDWRSEPGPRTLWRSDSLRFAFLSRAAQGPGRDVGKPGVATPCSGVRGQRRPSRLGTLS